MLPVERLPGGATWKVKHLENMKPTFSSSSFPILINLLHLSNDTYIKQEGRTTFISPNQIYAWETELLDTKDRLFKILCLMPLSKLSPCRL